MSRTYTLIELFRAIEEKSVRRLRALLSQGADIHTPVLHMYAKSPHAEAPLHHATRIGFVKGVKLLLSHGANVNVRGEDLQTPLHLAVKQESTDHAYFSIVHVLCEHGADIHATTAGANRTPLQIAVIYGRMDICKELIKRGSDLLVKDYTNNSAFQYAFRPERTALMEFMLQTHPELIDAPNKDGYSLIHLARQPKMMLAMLRMGANPCLRGPRGTTPLHEACKYRTDLPRIRLLVSYGADVNAVNDENQTPFRILWSGFMPFSHMAVICELLSLGADPSKGEWDVDWGHMSANNIQWNIYKQQYKKNTRIQLLMCAKRFHKSVLLQMLPVDVIRQVHVFLK